MQVVVSILLWCFFCIQNSVSTGAGDVVFTFLDRFNKTGVRAVFRPTDFYNYSSVGDDWSAKIQFFSEFSEKLINQGYEAKVLLTRNYGWSDMFWNTEGGYFYHDRRNEGILPRVLIGYGVDVLDPEGVLAYADVGHYYQVPCVVEYCELDGRGNNIVINCSQALDNIASTCGDLPGPAGDSPTLEILTNLVYFGAAFGGAIVIIGVVGICCCMRRSPDTPHTSSIDSIEMPEATTPTSAAPESDTGQELIQAIKAGSLAAFD